MPRPWWWGSKGLTVAAAGKPATLCDDRRCHLVECLLCQIVNGEVRAKVLYEDDFVVSFDISKDHVSGSASASRKCSGG